MFGNSTFGEILLAGGGRASSNSIYPKMLTWFERKWKNIVVVFNFTIDIEASLQFILERLRYLKERNTQAEREKERARQNKNKN